MLLTHSQADGVPWPRPLAAAPADTQWQPPPAQRDFPPSRFAALRRALAVDSDRYARTRNHLDGAVTALSPYFTHGLLGSDEALALWRERHGLGFEHTLMSELAWREFYRHVWSHAGEAIFEDMRPSVLPGVRYDTRLPDDMLAAATGIRVIDESVRRLYRDGYLHNHQRLWLASYCVHFRKLHWRSGADWMYGHLLDGDLASNHLSWQWVAGTFSNKPYLFNAANVERYAPMLASPGTPIDCDYDTLHALAANNAALSPARGFRAPCAMPRLHARPPRRLAVADFARLMRDADVTLIHPWNLARRPSTGRVIGVLHLPFHTRFPWSEKRWQFVLSRMTALCDAIWAGDLAQFAPVLENARTVQATATLHPGYAEAIEHLPLTQRVDPPVLFEPDAMAGSFSRYYKELRRAHPEWFPQRTPTPQPH